MTFDIEKLKSKHKILKEQKYTLGQVEKGYNKRTLYINISNNEIKEKPVSDEMIDKFTGGKGFDLRLLWDAVNENTKWSDPENEICISVGPVGGNTNYPGSGKSIVVSLSPMTNIPIDSNVGGHFGPYLKFSGFDALEVQGKAKNDVIIFINGDEGNIQIFEAPDEAIDSHILAEQLHEMFAKDENDKQHISVVSAGTAANHAYMGMLNFSFYDKRRKVTRLKQAGRGGIGHILRDKKIKALIVKYSGLKADNNHPVDLKKLQETGLKVHKEVKEHDDEQCRMRQVGTAHLVEIMNDYDLLPVKNFKFGADENSAKVHSKVWTSMFTQNMPDGCWFGCSLSCCKAIDNFIPRTGPYKGQSVTVDGPEYETVGGCSSNIYVWEPKDVAEINFYCDTYGIDTISFGTTMAFVMECWENKIITPEMTNGLDLSWGNADSVLEILHQMSRGEGFGVKVGKGTRWLKNWLVTEHKANAQFLQDIGMEAKGLEYSQYMSKESLAQQGGYTLALKGPQHDEAWLIFMDMVNNAIPTFEDKAEALHYFPMFRTWFGLQGLCKLPWNDIEPANNAETDEPAKVPEHVQNYLDIYEAVTGKKIDKFGMVLQSERVYNFQKIFNLRMGGGKRIDDIPPYRAVGPVTEEEYLSRQERYDTQIKELMDKDPSNMSLKEKMDLHRNYRVKRYETLVDSVYKRKGWDKNGIPTDEHLKKIGMDLPELLEVVKKFR
ncbi:MAG: aldehyde ferredoxin oxidoreductase C-terminal domain-containing protein [Candidatus Cloacimonetes bacterium]|jgi:aldehyde:ferredoxin oxidoreductase|nr:aldehyde:ferredoxin oxidoreductase [Candidatus Cloacimonadota bacterium]MDD4155496.1 aldehyde ferredoxin oxidoreductase C-terminal domain-containing protein [Candidatus Cloacimonadota bacterium]